MLRNRKDVPPWIEGLHLSEQSVDTQQFWDEETNRIMHGMTVDGVKISPWLYFHINHWKMFVDRLDNYGNIVRVPSLPDLRDNEWMFNEMVQKAESERKGLIIFGSRRIGKSCFISSYEGHSSIIRYGSDNVVVGGSDNDLKNITEYLDFALTNIHPFLRYDRTGTDWSKGVEFGTRKVDSTKEVFSRILVRNVNQGKASGAQSASGTTGTTLIFDEIGKYPVKVPFAAAKHSLSTPYGWRTCPILVGTSGEITLVRDAMDLFLNPGLYNLSGMDWELLERHCEHPTWVRKPCGHFMPGQMSLDEHCGTKTKTTLDKYLDVESRDLSKIQILVTNWEHATENLNAYLEELRKKDTGMYNIERMFLPRDTEDCFLSTSDNPYPVADAVAHRESLVSSGNTGKAVDVYLKPDGTMGYAFSMKEPVTKFPYEGGVSDTPVLMFEDPPERTRFDYRYVSGLDFYKTNVSGGSSLGAFYVFKRMTDIKDPFANRIVASFCGRPAMMDRYHRTCEALQEGYGCECLMEGIDIAYEQYLRGRNKDYRLLASGEDIIKKDVNKRASYIYKYGLTPTLTNKEYIMKLSELYCWEETGEREIAMPDGTVRVKKILGVERIPDIYLLDEIIHYKPGKNVDRLVAFGHALALARYYDSMKWMPKSEEEYRREEAARTGKRETPNRISTFGNANMKVSAFK
jgi:hypothetical protein